MRRNPTPTLARRRRAARRGAFVTTIAIMLIALVAVALAALTTRIGTTARQARQAREQAQVEQLMLAGMELSRQGGAEVDREIELPAALVEEGAKLRLLRTGKQLEIEAALGHTRMRQPMPTRSSPTDQ